jgi:ADP-ribose pyrophosphatase YjhB (NUDIX family)
MRPSEQLRFWAHELAAMARTGLEFATNDYDRDRFERTQRISESIAALVIDEEFTPERPYLPEIGIATPKVGCSVAAFDESGRVAIIRRADDLRWALPGGYAEVGTTPSANALRELREETGFDARLERLVGVHDNKSLDGVSPYHFFICLFRATITGGRATPSKETLEVVLARPDQLPEDMSRPQRTMLFDAVASEVDAPAIFQ